MPVCGLRPERAARCRSVKVPKPGQAKRPWSHTASPIVANVASSSGRGVFLLQTRQHHDLVDQFLSGHCDLLVVIIATKPERICRSSLTNSVR
jgi:hypothetical protein